MRMINDLLDIYLVDEVTSLDAQVAWNNEEGTCQENPGLFVVSFNIVSGNGNGIECNGEYLLDGTVETYQSAVRNFNEICVKAAEHGYFRLSDFQNFELW